MKKTIQTLALAAILALTPCLNGCVRNEMPVKQSTSKTKVDHLIIKEVFYIGHYWYRDVKKWGMKNINQMYNDDQYIAIYNPTNEVKYLDGLALCDNAIDPSKAIQFAPKDDFVNRYYGASSICYFPGSGTEHPVKPGQTVIIAKYAIDHKASFEADLEGEDLSDYKGHDAFLDLRKADFEWTNIQYDAGHKNNPDVPDMQAILTTRDEDGSISPSFDFLSVSESTGIALIKLPWTPDDFAKNYKDDKNGTGYRHYITVTSSAHGDFYAIEIPFDHVIDCMTICPRRLFQMRPSKLDRGYNAVADVQQISFKSGDYPIYSGLALMRKWDGKKFVDDNNSTSDFEVKLASLSRKDASGNPIK